MLDDLVIERLTPDLGFCRLQPSQYLPHSAPFKLLNFVFFFFSIKEKISFIITRGQWLLEGESVSRSFLRGSQVFFLFLFRVLATKLFHQCLYIDISSSITAIYMRIGNVIETNRTLQESGVAKDIERGPQLDSSSQPVSCEAKHVTNAPTRPLCIE